MTGPGVRRRRGKGPAAAGRPAGITGCPAGPGRHDRPVIHAETIPPDRRWLTCRWVRRFESGGCSETEFAAGVVADWQLGLSPAAFLEAFREWPVGPLPGAAELIAQTRMSVAAGCFSNTNALHWQDHAVNVAGAAAAGFQATRVAGVGQARQRLAEAGVLGTIA